MATTLHVPKKLQLTLLVDRISNKVIYAEAGKDFVDFLLGLLSIPLGHAARLLTADHMAGSLPALCTTFHELDDCNSLSNARSSSDETYYRCSGADTDYYYFDNYNKCYGNYGHVTDVSGTRCPSCKREMTTEMRFVAGGGREAKGKRVAAGGGGGGGYVKGVVTYMVMDNLEVTPMSTVSAITLLGKFHVADRLDSLYEWKVDVGKKEGLELLKASLQSKTVLTDVFLRKKMREVSMD